MSTDSSISPWFSGDTGPVQQVLQLLTRQVALHQAVSAHEQLPQQCISPAWLSLLRAASPLQPAIAVTQDIVDGYPDSSRDDIHIPGHIGDISVTCVLEEEGNEITFVLPTLAEEAEDS